MSFYFDFFFSYLVVTWHSVEFSENHNLTDFFFLPVFIINFFIQTVYTVFDLWLSRFQVTWGSCPLYFFYCGTTTFNEFKSHFLFYNFSLVFFYLCHSCDLKVTLRTTFFYSFSERVCNFPSQVVVVYTWCFFTPSFKKSAILLSSTFGSSCIS